MESPLQRLRLPGSARRGPRAWLRIYPFEIYTWAMLAVSVAFLRSRGLRMDWNTVEYTIAPLFKTLPGTFALGVGLVAFWTLLRGLSRSHHRLRPLTVYLRRVASLPWLLLWARLWLAAMVMTYVYFWVKVSIPLVDHRLWDQELWNLDVGLHLGISPSVFAAELLPGTALAGWVDAWYGIWIKTVTLVMAFFCAFKEPLLRRRFMFSCCLLWTLGTWLYMALPALGPIYVFPEIWADLRGSLPGAEGAQALLWENYQRMLAGREGMLRQFNPTRGIAAMPSLHVAAHVLFTLWIRRTLRPLFAPALLLTLATAFGAVLTGWHYAVDAYAGVGLGLACYWLACRLERR